MSSLGAGMPPMLSHLVGGVLIVWHGQGAPPDDMWETCVKQLDSRRDLPLRVLVLTEGAGPTAAQQLRLTRTIAARSLPLPIAVISDSTRVRFMASTLALFTKRIRTFRGPELTEALAFLELDEIETRAANEFIAHLPDRASMPINP